MKTLYLHYPVQVSMTVKLYVDDHFDPTDIDALQEKVTQNDLLNADVDEVEWDHLKDAWRYTDSDDCWVTDDGDGYFTNQLS